MKTKAPHRVLVCDDVAMIRRALRRFLRIHSEFHVVGEAAGGQESIAQALKLKPDLVLMDVRMPDLDGIEGTRRILLAVPGTRVLAFSSDAARVTVDRMLAAGPSGYVVKGADPDELICAARTVLAGGHYSRLRALSGTTQSPRNNKRIAHPVSPPDRSLLCAP